nr:uncharacterized protein LOC115103815 [Oncorhynchus nerka]
MRTAQPNPDETGLQVGLSTLDRVLQRNRIRMKRVYRGPFEQNSRGIKNSAMDMCKVLELDAAAIQHVYMYIESGFKLAKRQGWNIIGHRAIVNVPGQRGGNITMCAAVGQQGVPHHHANLGPYNTALLITFLDTLHGILIPDEQRGGPEQLVDRPPTIYCPIPPTIFPIPKPNWRDFLAWRRKVYDRHPLTRMPLLQAMEDA